MPRSLPISSKNPSDQPAAGHAPSLTHIHESPTIQVEPILSSRRATAGWIRTDMNMQKLQASDVKL
jgi:hypothetical protein